MLIELFVIAISIYAGPFGLEMGMSLSQVNKISKINIYDQENMIYTIIPPKNHPEFNLYYVMIAPKNGLCEIIAYGKENIVSKSGKELKDKFNSIKKSIDSTYGIGSITEIDSTDEKDLELPWLNRIYNGSATLRSNWDKNIVPNISKTIKNIELSVHYSLKSWELGYLELIYTFSNIELALNEIKNVPNSVF
jgi:hypothetical protein